MMSKAVSLSRLGRIAVVAALTTVGGVSAAGAQTASEIVDALMPKPLTRSLSTAPMASPTASADAAFLDSVRSRPIQALSADERNKLAALTSQRPSIDLEIPFSYNSAAIRGPALTKVKALGAALSNRDLKGGTFLIAGHTDGRGSAEANQKLSERRAEAVKRYIAENFGVPPTSLISVGYGKSRLKQPGEAMAGANRRVEVTNISDVRTSSR